MRGLVLIVVLLVSACAFTQVTYKTTGASVAKVVADVAKSTDQKWIVDEEIAREIVVVSVRDVSLDEFKKRLADCMSSKWVEKEGGVLEFRVDASLSADRQKAAQEAYAKGIPAQIKSSLEMYSQEGVGAIRQDSPSVNELALEIGKRIPESQYRNVTPNGRVVFSSQPNRMQLKLPDVSDLVSKHLDPEPASFIKEIVFAIERPNFDNFTRFALYGLDGSGRPGRAITFTFISLGSISKSTPPTLTGSVIKWSPVSLEIAKLYRNWGYRATNGLLSMPQSVRDALSKPTEIDPMAYGFGEGILACAEEKGENVMACIPDDNVGGVFSMGIQGTTTGEFWRRVLARNTLISARENSWITIRPTDPVAAREMRGDRAALEKLINKGKGKVWPAFDDIAEFSASNISNRSLPMAFVVPYQALVNSNGRADKAYESSFRPLQLYTCLSQSEKQKLRNGERLAFPSLSAKAKEVLGSALFEPSGAVLSFNVNGEPTELFPLGLDGSFSLSAKVSPTIVFAPLPDAGDATMAPAPMSPRDIAMNRWSKLYDDNPYAQEIPEMNRVLVGSREVWRFSLLRSQEQIGTITVASDSIPKDAQPTTMEALPQNTKDVLETAYREYLKEMGGGG